MNKLDDSGDASESEPEDVTPTDDSGTDMSRDASAYWAATPVEMPAKPETEQITAKFDRDMVDWFRAHGRGYQARMNAVLRTYYTAHKDD